MTLSHLFEPRFFNFVIMALYCTNMLWWAWHRQWAHVAYWSGALWITAAVTFGYGGK